MLDVNDSRDSRNTYGENNTYNSFEGFIIEDNNQKKTSLEFVPQNSINKKKISDFAKDNYNFKKNSLFFADIEKTDKKYYLSSNLEHEQRSKMRKKLPSKVIILDKI